MLDPITPVPIQPILVVPVSMLMSFIEWIPKMDGGILTIEWDNKGHVILSGPAQIVFEGEFDLESIHQDDKL